MKITLEHESESFAIDLTPSGNSYRVSVGDRISDVQILQAEDGKLAEDIDSAAFKVIVGPPKYTKGGLPVGTTVDIAETAAAIELKGGRKMIESSYQLRLQTYRALKTDTPLSIRTTRPVNPTFDAWLKRWGVTVENLATPGVP